MAETTVIVEDPETGEDVVFVGATQADAEEAADDHFGALGEAYSDSQFAH